MGKKLVRESLNERTNPNRSYKDPVAEIDRYYDYIKSHPDFEPEQAPYTDETDSIEGPVYGFHFKSKYPIENEPEMHIGEYADCFVGYYEKEDEIIYVFDNNGYSAEINSLEELDAHLQF